MNKDVEPRLVGGIDERENEPEKIVGHKTMRDGARYPVYESEAKALLDHCEAEKEKRAADMPTEQDAIREMWRAHYRLRELGWREAMYCPKDGSVFEVIEAGSTGIFDCIYQGAWPDGSYWIVEDGDMCPSDPILFREKKK